MLDNVVPIRETIKNLDFLFKIDFVRLLSLYCCFTQTSICSLFADINAISKLENIIDNIRPVIVKFNSIAIYEFK